jgi:hypothetical protein
MLALIACHAANPSPASPGHRERSPNPFAEADFIHFQWEDCVPAPRNSPFTDPAGAGPVALVDSVVLDMTGIDSAWVWRAAQDTADHWDVVVRLSRTGAADFGATTATHVGRRLAVVVDQRVVLMPVVESPLHGPALIASGVARHEADSLAARVNQAVVTLRPFQPGRIVRQSLSRPGSPRC